jgi:hypothetical protein
MGVMIGKVPTHLGLLETASCEQSTPKNVLTRVCIIYILLLKFPLLYKVQGFHYMMLHK